MHQKAEWTSWKASQNSSSTVAHVLKSSTEHQNIAPSYRLQNSGLDVMYHSVLCCSTPRPRGSTGGNCPLLQIPKNDLFPNIVVWCCLAQGGWEALVCCTGILPPFSMLVVLAMVAGCAHVAGPLGCVLVL